MVNGYLRQDEFLDHLKVMKMKMIFFLHQTNLLPWPGSYQGQSNQTWMWVNICKKFPMFPKFLIYSFKERQKLTVIEVSWHIFVQRGNYFPLAWSGFWLDFENDPQTAALQVISEQKILLQYELWHISLMFFNYVRKGQNVIKSHEIINFSKYWVARLKNSGARAVFTHPLQLPRSYYYCSSFKYIQVWLCHIKLSPSFVSLCSWELESNMHFS